jgi:hypothetical protein
MISTGNSLLQFGTDQAICKHNTFSQHKNDFFSLLYFAFPLLGISVLFALW